MNNENFIFGIFLVFVVFGDEVVFGVFSSGEVVCFVCNGIG